MRRRTGKGGFTLIEMLIAITILAIFMAFVFSNLVSTQRLTKIEEIRLDMDRAANGALQQISILARDAYLPIRMFSSGVAATAIADNTTGFGANAVAWENALLGGTNFVPFALPVDVDGSGDLLDDDMLPYLGVVRGGSVLNDSGYTVGSYSLPAGGNINPGLAAIQPTDLNANPPVYALNGVVPNGAYGIIRFVPFLDGGVPVTVNENDLGCDFNGDGVLSSFLYYVGNLEVYYPECTGPGGGTVSETRHVLGTMDMVLAPDPGMGSGPGVEVQPIFTLVAMDMATGGLTTTATSGTSGRPYYDALRVQLTLINFHDRGAAGAQKTGFERGNVTARKYETMIRVRNQ